MVLKASLEQLECFNLLAENLLSRPYLLFQNVVTYLTNEPMKNLSSRVLQRVCLIEEARETNENKI